jgi:hypothetical protein
MGTHAVGVVTRVGTGTRVVVVAVIGISLFSSLSFLWLQISRRRIIVHQEIYSKEC